MSLALMLEQHLKHHRAANMISIVFIAETLHTIQMFDTLLRPVVS